MCGICGTAGFVDAALIERMTDELAHRGPDDRGTLLRLDANVALGNRRLSILDLSSAGHMPMEAEGGRVALTYNGEIYNFPELRAELETLGQRFRSRTDTEVILRGWLQWGRALLPRLNGMFAFALLDMRGPSPELVLARDRYGIKPLYYATLGERLLFGSELRAILAHPGIGREARPEAVHRYLAFLSAPGPDTTFAAIRKLAPGHALTWRQGRIDTAPFHALAFEPDESLRSDAAASLRGALEAAVHRHLIADVPVGVFLSGGLDSSFVAALAARASGEAVRAYTIGFRPEDSRLEQAGDEDARHARIVAQAIGAEHHEIVLDPSIAELLPFAVRHLEEPLADPAAISTYLICRAAKTDVKVLLSGHGADELFAGYRVHRNDRVARLLQRVPEPLLRGSAGALVSALPSLRNRIPGVHPGLVMAAHRYLARLLEGTSLPPEERYVYFRRNMSEDALRALYTPDFASQLREDAGARHLELFAEAPARDFLNRVLYVDQRTYLPDHNLLYSDKMSSAASLELRVPFLDNEVTALAARMPVDLKLAGFTGKRVLRDAAAGIVPDAVIRRRKAGFGVPVRAWLQGELRPMIDDLLSEGSVRARGYFRPAEVRRMVDEHRSGRSDQTYPLWALLCLELWHRELADG